MTMMDTYALEAILQSYLQGAPRFSTATALDAMVSRAKGVCECRDETKLREHLGNRLIAILNVDIR
jgi:hypothetical protein